MFGTWLEDTLKERQRKKDREEREWARLKRLDVEIIAERKKAREEGLKEGRAASLQIERSKILEEGIEVGLVLGRKEERQKWQTWNRRRESAESAGVKFSEMPPA